MKMKTMVVSLMLFALMIVGVSATSFESSTDKVVWTKLDSSGDTFTLNTNNLSTTDYFLDIGQDSFGFNVSAGNYLFLWVKKTEDRKSFFSDDKILKLNIDENMNLRTLRNDFLTMKGTDLGEYTLTGIVSEVNFITREVCHRRVCKNETFKILVPRKLQFTFEIVKKEAPVITEVAPVVKKVPDSFRNRARIIRLQKASGYDLHFGLNIIANVQGYYDIPNNISFIRKVSFEYPMNKSGVTFSTTNTKPSAFNAKINASEYFNFVAYGFGDKISDLKLMIEYRCPENSKLMQLVEKSWTEVPVLSNNGGICSASFKASTITTQFAVVN